MRSPMTDNARIVREALEEAIKARVALYRHSDWDGDTDAMTDDEVATREPYAKEWLKALPALTALETELAAAKAREAGLTKAIAEVQADLERAREAVELVLKRFEPVIDTFIFNKRMALTKLRAALAPERKG